MRRLGVLLLVGVAACTSTWEQHRIKRDDALARHAYGSAMAQTRWMIDNAFSEAPLDQRTAAAEAHRYLELADIAERAQQPQAAIEALRQALQADPHQAPAIRTALGRLPAAERARVEPEFAWNIAALDPGEPLPSPTPAAALPCWSYGAQQIRVRTEGTLRTVNGMERRVLYDARRWRFDAPSDAWRPVGRWVESAGMEREPVDGPERPRYRAVVAADHGFYTDGSVPPCHRGGWRGPYGHDGTVFTTAHLPETRGAAAAPDAATESH